MDGGTTTGITSTGRATAGTWMGRTGAATLIGAADMLGELKTTAIRGGLVFRGYPGGRWRPGDHNSALLYLIRMLMVFSHRQKQTEGSATGTDPVIQGTIQGMAAME
jgi:hypothetical protein